MLSRMPRESSTSGSWRRELANALRDKRATVGVVGLGYVGLPMLVCAARAGFRAVGLDVDPTRVEALVAGQRGLVECRHVRRDRRALRPVVAIARTLPARTWVMADATLLNMKSISPLMSATPACPALLYGT